MKQNLFELAVTVPSSRGSTKIPEYGHNGLTFVEGRKGQPYTIKLHNNSAHRVLAVVSVDGLSVTEGDPCTPKSGGYILPPYGSFEIAGWRSSLSTVHKFKFTDKTKSYAKSSEVASDLNCGIIAAKFFSEKPKPVAAPNSMPIVIREEHHHHYPPVYTPTPWPYLAWMTTSAGTTGQPISTYNGSLNAGQLLNASTPLTESPGCPLAVTDNSKTPKFELGTGWGEEHTNEVNMEFFNRDVELCTLELYYATGAELKAAGVTLTKNLTVTPPASPVLPQAFTGFCKPPVNR